MPINTVVTWLLALLTIVSLSRVEARTRLDQIKESPVVAIAKLEIEGYPNAQNPSIANTPYGIVLTFKVCPEEKPNEIARIGIVLLNDEFEPISEPMLLDTRETGTSPYQSEDARVIWAADTLYLFYNDNVDQLALTLDKRRDMYMSTLTYVDGRFVMQPPCKLTPPLKHRSQLWQKNWVPFVYEGALFAEYTINPQEILWPDPVSGLCESLYKTKAPLYWSWGIIRGGTPALLMDDEYLAFFHSVDLTRSIQSPKKSKAYYYVGAYTFSAKPPFEMTSISSAPIFGEEFYAGNTLDKVVYFPGGYLDCGANLLLAYGKDDCELWMAKIDKRVLKDSMEQVH